MAACLSKTLKLKRSLPCSFQSSSSRPLAASFSSNASPPIAAATDAAAAASSASQSQGWHFPLTFSALTSLIFSCFFFFFVSNSELCSLFQRKKEGNCPKLCSSSPAQLLSDLGPGNSSEDRRRYALPPVSL